MILNNANIETLYTKYLEIIHFETLELGCNPTELRHLIGRLGEFYCALTVNGTLALETNQKGYDVISESGKRISVKTTAQKNGFISININTIDLADEFMFLHYNNNKISILYYGDTDTIIQNSRVWGKTYEIDISKLIKLYN